MFLVNWTTVGLNIVHFRCKTKVMHGIYFKYSVIKKKLCIWTDDNSLLDYVKTHCSLIITSHANVLTAVDSCTDLPQTELNSFSKLQQKTKTKKKGKEKEKS